MSASEERKEQEGLCFEMKSSKYEGKTPFDTLNSYMQQNFKCEAETHKKLV